MQRCGMDIGTCCVSARNVQPRVRKRGDFLLPVHDPSRCHEGDGRCDGREHPGPNPITFTNASRNTTSDTDAFGQSCALADTDGDFHSCGYAFANDCSAVDRDQYASATHDRDSRADARHAKPNAARGIESYNDSHTDRDACRVHKCFASTGSAHSDTGRRRPGLASEQSGPGCWGASARRRLALDSRGLRPGWPAVRNQPPAGRAFVLSVPLVPAAQISRLAHQTFVASA